MPLFHIASIEERAGARVAIIDSGIHASHPHVQQITEGVGIDAKGQEYSDFVDSLGHGTAVAAAIREKAPSAELLAVKVFERTLATTPHAIAAAIRWAALRAELINLSLGTTNASHERILEDAIGAAESQAALVVAAAADERTRWLPGAIASPAIVAVTLDWTCARDECAIEIESGRLRARASGWPRPIPGVPPERNLKGISFAVANATGFLARILAGCRSPAERLERIRGFT
jgi:Subtilase family